MLLSEISCEINESNNTKTNCDSTQYYYNERLLVDSVFQWRDAVLSFKDNHFYDERGNDTLVLWYSWSETLKFWKLYDNKYVYTYDYEYSEDDLIYKDFLYEEGMKNLPLTYTCFSSSRDEDSDEQESSTTYFYYSEKTVTALLNNETTSANYYPNPASSTIQVSEEVLQTTILDLYGKPVLKSKVNTIDVSGLENGSYILLLETEKGVSSEKLLISK